jgi:hypothetical protein
LDDEEPKEKPKQKEIKNNVWLKFKEQPSNLDLFCADCPAQYATMKETPRE